MTTLLLALAGGAGAFARAEVSARGGARVGTAAANLLGAALLGLLVGLGDRVSHGTLRVLGTGFCGGFTTFSTWMVEVGREDAWRDRALWALGPLALGVAVAAAAHALAG